MQALWLSALLGLLATGCYEVPQDRLTDDIDSSMDRDIQQCSMSLRTGCVQGTIMAAPEIYVNNRKFEDSEDFALMFSELVTVENKDGETLDRDLYSIELMTPINNRHFTNDFQIYLRGSDARTTDVLRNGSFQLNHLRPGVYDVRAQRKLVFKVTKNEVLDKDSGDVLEAESEKFYCATLKSEQTLQLGSGQRVDPVFEEFDLFWREQGCSGEELNFGIVTL